MKSRIIVALDYSDGRDALALVRSLDPSACAVKIGNELFTAAGPTFVRDCVERGFRVFLDLKYHDIPNTVASACAAATRLGVWMMNVHAVGGAAMLSAARDAVARASQESERPAPLLIAVTVLTSLAAPDLNAIGVNDTPDRAVARLARLAQANGIDGVVCSAHEASMLREQLGTGFILVTPGIRLAGATADDQERIATPQVAIRAGADFLVIGRPITRAADPGSTLASIRRIIGEIA